MKDFGGGVDDDDGDDCSDVYDDDDGDDRGDGNDTLSDDRC